MSNIILQRVSSLDLTNQESLELLRDWRIKNKFAYVGNYEVTTNSIKKWLQDYVLSKKDRNLYWVIVEGVKVGTIGESNITQNSVELSDVSRGIDAYPGVMHEAMEKILAPYLVVYLKVVRDNAHAIDFYGRNGFKVVGTEEHYLIMQRYNNTFEGKKRNVH